jgi:glycerol kinase
MAATTREQFILALDQGTTSSRAIVFARDGSIRALAQQEYTQHYPQPGWVEHDANDIWQTQLAVARAALRDNGIAASQIAAVGLTNQRETTVLWDRASGEPLHRAIVWQDRRTAGLCDSLARAGHGELFGQRTGLVLDAYFSGTKLKWLLDHIPGARARAERGELAFGTIDSWLAWKLSGGRVHVTDPSNASRTLLYDIRRLRWDDELLALLDCPAGRAAAGRRQQRRRGLAGQRPARRPDPAGRHRRRPAGGYLRAGLPGTGHGQEYLRDRLLPAAQHRSRRP